MNDQRGDHFPIAQDLPHVGVFLGAECDQTTAISSSNEDGGKLGNEIPCLAHDRFAAKIVQLQNKFGIVMRGL